MRRYEDRERAESFGDDAARYDRARPSYPMELVDDIVAGVRGSPARRVVDIGCGTGTVARLFATRGLDVLGVEADGRMAAVARDNGLEVEVARFEDWDGAGRLFDVLVSGQAWHWVDPEVGVAKAGAVLRPGGRFAVFWNGLTHAPEVAAAFEEIYGRLAPDLLLDFLALGTSHPSGERDRPAVLQAGLFDHIEHRVHEWERRYTTVAWIDELPTHSAHRLLDPTVRERLLVEVEAAVDALGGEMTVAYRTAALFATRR